MSKMTHKEFITTLQNRLDNDDHVDPIKKLLLEEKNQPKSDNKIIGNINLRKDNSLYTKIDIKFKEVLNYEELTISFAVLLNGIEIGKAHKHSKYNNKMTFTFESNYKLLNITEGNYTLDAIILSITTRVKEIQSFIALYD